MYRIRIKLLIAKVVHKYNLSRSCVDVLIYSDVISTTKNIILKFNPPITKNYFNL